MRPEPLVDIEENVHVDASPETLWRLVSDVRRHPEFAGPRSITKAIEFDGPLEEGGQWIAHERFGPQRFDARSDITKVDSGHELAWVSFPPAKKEEYRGEGGRVLWSYRIEPEGDGSRLSHHMTVLPPEKGATSMKAIYAILRLPRQQRRGIKTSLENIKTAAESSR